MSDHEHTSPTGHSDHGDHNHSHGGLGIYLAVALALVILTAFSYWTFTPLWPFGENVAIKWLWMMAVSCCKATLVIVVFMHLYWEANWKWVLTVPASLMSVFLCLALVPDVGWRKDNGFGGYSRERMLYAATPADEPPEGDHPTVKLHDPQELDAAH